MSHAIKISVALTPEIASQIQQAVESGDYAASSEVIREALREWKQRRTLLQHEREHLQELWAEGVASGNGRFSDIQAIKVEARRRMSDEKSKVAG